MIRFVRTTLPTALGLNVADTWDSIRSRLIRWVEQVEGALRALPRLEVRTLAFTGGQVDVPVALAFAPLAVLCAGARAVGEDGSVDGAVTIDWSGTGRGYRINSASGLTTGTEYELVLVAMGVD